jgi:hypothetical protein
MIDKHRPQLPLIRTLHKLKLLSMGIVVSGQHAWAPCCRTEKYMIRSRFDAVRFWADKSADQHTPFSLARGRPRVDEHTPATSVWCYNLSALMRNPNHPNITASAGRADAKDCLHLSPKSSLSTVNSQSPTKVL